MGYYDIHNDTAFTGLLQMITIHSRSSAFPHFPNHICLSIQITVASAAGPINKSNILNELSVLWLPVLQLTTVSREVPTCRYTHLLILMLFFVVAPSEQTQSQLHSWVKQAFTNKIKLKRSKLKRLLSVNTFFYTFDSFMFYCLLCCGWELLPALLWLPAPTCTGWASRLLLLLTFHL